MAWVQSSPGNHQQPSNDVPARQADGQNQAEGSEVLAYHLTEVLVDDLPLATAYSSGSFTSPTIDDAAWYDEAQPGKVSPFATLPSTEKHSVPYTIVNGATRCDESITSEWGDPFNPTPIHPRIEQTLRQLDCKQPSKHEEEDTEYSSGPTSFKAWQPKVSKYEVCSQKVVNEVSLLTPCGFHDIFPVYQSEDKHEVLQRRNLNQDSRPADLDRASISIDRCSSSQNSLEDHTDELRSSEYHAKEDEEGLRLYYRCYSSGDIYKDHKDELMNSEDHADEEGLRLYFGVDRTVLDPTSNQANDLSETSTVSSQSFQRLIRLMEKSIASQNQLQEWDLRLGLPKCHSWTMMHTNRSRRQLREGRVLPKWNGKPLIGDKSERISPKRKQVRSSMTHKVKKRDTQSRSMTA